MPSITSVVPPPRVVALAGRDWLVGELRLGDLWELQAWLDARHGDPLAVVRPRLAEPTKEWRPLVIDAYDAAEAGPPTFGTDRARVEFGTAEGIVAFVWIVLRRAYPSLTAEDAVSLATLMEPHEYAALRRAVFDVDPLDECEPLLGFGEESGGSEPKWGEWLAQVCAALGQTWEGVARMTLSEFFNALNEGRAPVRGVAVGDGEDVAAVARRMRAKFYGTDGADG